MFALLAHNAGGISRFSRTYVRVFRDGVAGQWRLFVAVCVSDVAAAVCQGMVVGTLVTASRVAPSAEQAATPSSFLGYVGSFLAGLTSNVDLSKSALIFYVAAAISAILLMVSVGSTYLAAILSRRLARRYHERSVVSLLESYFGKNCFGLLSNTSDFQVVQRALMQYSLHSSKALEAVSRLFQTTAFMLVFFASAFLVEWRVMSLMAACGLLFLPVIIFVARHTHSVASSFFETSSINMGQTAAQLLRTIDGFYQPNEDRNRQIDTFMRSEPVQVYFDNYDGIQLASDRMNFLTGLVRAGIFGFGMILITTAVAFGWVNTTIIVAFAGVLLLAFAYLQSLFSRLANLNLYYPQVVRFFSVQDYAKHDPVQPGSTALASTRRLIVGSFAPKKQPEGLLDTIDIGAGDVVDFLTAVPLSRYDMGRWLGPLRGSAMPSFDGSDIVLVTNRVQDLSPLTIPDLETGLEKNGLGRIEDLARRLGVDDSFRKWHSRLTASNGSVLLDAATLKDLPSELRALVAFAVAASSNASTVFIEAGTVAHIRPERRQEARAVLAGKLVFVWRQPTVTAPLEPDCHLVLGANGQLALFSKGILDTVLQSALPEKAADAAQGDELEATLMMG
jgi:hypothetical protein